MREYWFKQDAESIAKRLEEFHGNWQIWGNNPISQAWVRNIISYYSTVLDANSWDTSLVYTGEQGELVKMQVPQARSLARQFISVACKQKLAFNTVAQSAGQDVIKETRLGNALAEQIVDNQSLDRKGEALAEMAYVMGSAYTLTRWRTDKGIPYAAKEDGTVVYDGDLEISVVSPFDVFYDYTVPSWDDLDWVEVRVLRNRWDLIAQFPDLETEILALPSNMDWRGPTNAQTRTITEDDMVWVFEAYHRQTPSLPKGRMLMYGSNKAVFFDGINRYGELPLEPCIPEPIFGMLFGYPGFSSLLPAQELLDHSFSAIATNQSAFAVQNVTCPRGANINVQNILGMNWISFTPSNVSGGGKPEALQLTASAPETFKFIDILQSHMTQLSGVSAAMRGQLPPGVTSGTAIATLTTNSLEFMTSFQKAWARCIEKTVMKGINTYRRFSDVPHLVRLTGKNFQSYSQEFVGTDLDPIQAVKLELENPLMKTLAGRLQVSEKLIEMGAVKSTEDYLSILNGAPTQQMYDTDLSENDLIEAEAKALLDGKPVVALIIDNHPRHIMKHKALLNDPQVRLHNPNVQQILAHMQEHEQMAMNPANAMLMSMANTGRMPQMPPPSTAPQQAGGVLASDVISGEPPGAPAAPPASPAKDLLGRAG